MDLSTWIKIAVVAMFLSSAIYIHFRGRVRHRFKRQLTDHSTFMAPYNVFVYARSAVPNTPILKVDEFPELKLLRDNWEIIRDEAQQLYGRGLIRQSDKTNDLAFNSFFRKGWTRFYLKWYRDYLPSALQACPRTIELLRQTPSVKAAMFTVLQPHSNLGEHRDPFAGSLRYHLGLVTPNSDDCAIWVDGNKYAWRDGQDVVFDETYVHSAKNDTDQYRIILFCDIERPMKGPISRAVNHAFGRVMVAAAASRNLPEEKLGAFNHLFAYIYSIRRAGKWMKDRSKRGYYALKYVAMAAFAAWIFLPPLHP
nr:aspartyl/asparaginyl beta-hydroxylase domain-containing protein [Solimonas marina]